jgi:subtilisin family serine protease
MTTTHERPTTHSTSATRRARRRLRIWLVAGIGLLGLAPEMVAADASAGLKRRRVAGRLVVRGRAGLTTAALAKALAASGARRVRVVPALGATVIDMPEEELVQVERALRRARLFKSVERDYTARIAEIPNDPNFGAQWGVSKIGAPAAWNATRGGSALPVAVLDTGVDNRHPDLSGQLLPGYDLVNGDADPADDHGHGTRMSGIIAARWKNATGIAGVAPETAILPVKVMDANGSGSYSRIAEGIVYAVDHGARVVNLSLAGGAATDVMQSAVDYARARGVVVVAAAGNTGTGDPQYPAACTGAVAVAASDENDRRASFSNYGSHLSVAAPGANILTTSLGGGYSYSTGTSPAAAFGSALFALLLARDATLTVDAARARIEQYATDLGTMGWDPYFGVGRIDAQRTVTADGSSPTGSTPDSGSSSSPAPVAGGVGILSPAPYSLVSGMVPVDLAVTDGVEIARVDLLVDGRAYASEDAAPFAFVVDASVLAPGRHTLTAMARSTTGTTWSASIKIWTSPTADFLVTRATLKARRIVVHGHFALPETPAWDAQADGVRLTLTSAAGEVVDVNVDPAAVVAKRSGEQVATVALPAPLGGTAVVRIVPPTWRQRFHTLKAVVTTPQQVPTPSGAVNVALHAGETTLSQGINLRAVARTLRYP